MTSTTAKSKILPLDLRQGKRPTPVERLGETMASRTADVHAGHPRPAHTQGRLARADARLGHFAAHSANLKGSAGGQSGLPLPRPAWKIAIGWRLNGALPTTIARRSTTASRRWAENISPWKRPLGAASVARLKPCCSLPQPEDRHVQHRTCFPLVALTRATPSHRSGAE